MQIFLKVLEIKNLTQWTSMWTQLCRLLLMWVNGIFAYYWPLYEHKKTMMSENFDTPPGWSFRYELFWKVRKRSVRRSFRCDGRAHFRDGWLLMRSELAILSRVAKELAHSFATLAKECPRKNWSDPVMAGTSTACKWSTCHCFTCDDWPWQHCLNLAVEVSTVERDPSSLLLVSSVVWWCRVGLS